MEFSLCVARSFLEIKKILFPNNVPFHYTYLGVPFVPGNLTVGAFKPDENKIVMVSKNLEVLSS